jgi:putative transposase
VSITHLCEWFSVPRSTFYSRAERRRCPVLDQALVELVGRLIEENPDYGVRRLTVLVRRELQAAVNRKKIHRILKANGWQVRQRPRGQRPRVHGWVLRVERPNERWAIDVTHVFSGQDGWCHLTAIIDCCDRTIVGWRLSRSGVARIAAAALEDALRR